MRLREESLTVLPRLRLPLRQLSLLEPLHDELQLLSTPRVQRLQPTLRPSARWSSPPQLGVAVSVGVVVMVGHLWC